MTRLLKILVLACLLVAGPGYAQTIEYIHTDGLGSPVAATDANGNVIERSEYEPYGAMLNRPPDDRPGYTGHVADAATGLNYMEQRYYDPQIGRFLSVDPVVAREKGDNFNRYAYAFNNPYRFTDPDGREGNETFSETAAWGDLNYANSRTMTAEDAAVGLEITADVAAGVAADVALGGPTGEAIPIIGSLRAARAADKLADAQRAGGGARRAARDASKNEKHGDGGRAMKSAKDAAGKLREQAKGLPRKERQAMEKKAQRIERDAERKRKGEEHSLKGKR